MPRVHLFEFDDQTWFPRVLADGGAAYLRALQERFGLAESLVPIVEDALQRGNVDRVVDLCAGNGGPTHPIVRRLIASGSIVEWTTTDRRPARLGVDQAGHVTAHAAPVSATDVPCELAGLRTIFNAFHHFDDDSAMAVLTDATAKQQPILIVALDGAVRGARGEFDTGAAKLAEALELAGDVAPSGVLRSAILQELARLQFAGGRYAECAVVQREALQLREQELGDDHPRTLEARLVLAAALGHGPEQAEAETLFATAIPALRRVCGPDHPLALNAERNWCAFLQRGRREAEALPVIRALAERVTRLRGDAHRTTAEIEH
ncbi:MAG: tetratricopeptide repeat protein [Planctomycetota bacterium]